MSTAMSRGVMARRGSPGRATPWPGDRADPGARQRRWEVGRTFSLGSQRAASQTARAQGASGPVSMSPVGDVAQGIVEPSVRGDTRVDVTIRVREAHLLVRALAVRLRGLVGDGPLGP